MSSGLKQLIETRALLASCDLSLANFTIEQEMERILFLQKKLELAKLRLKLYTEVLEQREARTKNADMSPL